MKEDKKGSKTVYNCLQRDRGDSNTDAVDGDDDDDNGSKWYFLHVKIAEIEVVCIKIGKTNE